MRRAKRRVLVAGARSIFCSTNNFACELNVSWAQRSGYEWRPRLLLTRAHDSLMRAHTFCRSTGRWRGMLTHAQAWYKENGTFRRKSIFKTSIKNDQQVPLLFPPDSNHLTWSTHNQTCSPCIPLYSTLLLPLCYRVRQYEGLWLKADPNAFFPLQLFFWNHRYLDFAEQPRWRSRRRSSTQELMLQFKAKLSEQAQTGRRLFLPTLASVRVESTCNSLVRKN